MNELYSIRGFHDPMSSISHLAGAVVFFVLAIFMVRSAWGTRPRFWYTFVFAFSSVLMLTMSFVYHMFQPGYAPRAVLLRLDVAAIFILIAGTFTPVHGILFVGWKRWGILGLLWSITIVGVTLRTIFFDSIPDFVGVGIFLAIGWIGALSAYLLYENYGWMMVKPVFLGGVLYSVGAIINTTNSFIFIPMVWGPHETFHLFVLAALATHWSMIAKIADGSIVRHESHPSTAP